MSRRPIVLVIDDEVEALEILSLHLERDGYEALTAASGIEGLRLAYEHQPDAVILDIRMPGMDGREVCARLRDITDAPILIVSVLSSTEEAVRNLELGADDYLTKPVQYAELSARLAANLRRRDLGSRPLPGIAGTWRVDEARREIIVEDRRVQLTPKEFVVFKLFMRRPEEVLSVDQILFEAWGPEYEGDADLVKQFVYRLRSKLELDPAYPRYFRTVRGSGYSFEPGAPPDASAVPKDSELQPGIEVASPDPPPQIGLSEFRRKARESSADADTPVALRPSSSRPTPKRLPKIGPASVTFTTRVSDFAADLTWPIRDWFGGWPKVNAAWLLLPSALLALLLGGALVQASQSALPGDGAYPVKLLVEQAQVWAAIDDARALELRLEFLQRRVSEIATLADSGRTAEIPNAAVRLQGEVKQTISSVSRDRLAEFGAESPGLDEGLEALMQLRDQSPNELEPAYSSAIEATQVLRSRMLGIGQPKLATDLVTRMTVDSLTK